MVYRPPFATLSWSKSIIFGFMLQDKEIIISNYPSKTAKTNNDINLFDELHRIKNGYLKSQIEKCRLLLSQGLVKEYKLSKLDLPAVTYSGKFNGSHKAENLICYSQLMIIDFDGLNDLNLSNLKKEIFSDKHVLAVWLSPSNRGVKVLLKTNSNPETHKIYFDEVCEYLAKNYNLEADKSGSDICRICFTSYDPDILIKEKCIPFTTDIERNEKKIISKGSKEITTQIDHTKLEKSLFYATEGRNSHNDRNTIDKIIKFLKVRKLSITSSYQEWYRVALAIANTFTFDLGKKYFLYLCQLDGVNHDEYKSINLLEYCYRNRKVNTVNFSTIVYLAEQKGFINKVKYKTDY